MSQSFDTTSLGGLWKFYTLPTPRKTLVPTDQPYPRCIHEGSPSPGSRLSRRGLGIRTFPSTWIPLGKRHRLLHRGGLLRLRSILHRIFLPSPHWMRRSHSQSRTLHPVRPSRFRALKRDTPTSSNRRALSHALSDSYLQWSTPA